MFPHKVPFLRANSLIMQIFNVLHVEFQIFSWLTKVALLGVTLSGLDVLEVLETSLAPIRISNSNSTFSLNYYSLPRFSS